MKKIRLTLEYDGTAYVGWQIQPNGLSVQEVVENALAKVTGRNVRLVSSGRTDAGVHARGMVAHFPTALDLPMSAFREGVNRFLPPDVAVREASEVPSDFHARYCARGKWYRYRLYLAPVRSPLEERTSWHIRTRLDVESMKKAAQSFVGHHDFSAFRSSGCDAKTTDREVFAVSLSHKDDILMVDVKGAGFLKNMVRVMVGTLVEIGMGKRPWQDVDMLLQNGNRAMAGKTAPPQGLCLMEVWY